MKVTRDALSEVKDDAEQDANEQDANEQPPHHKYDDPWFPANQEEIPPEYTETCSTCGQPMDSPPCSLNREIGWSGHTVSGGACVPEVRDA